MPTNEERREIAKAIRKTAQQSFLGTRFFTPHSIERLLNLEVEGTFLGIDYYTVGSVLRLADLIEPEPITGETSDGYHTFNELYDHRARLFSVIVAAFPERAWKSKMHHDGTMYDGMFIVGIKTPDGQATYHYDIDPYWSMFRCKEIDRAPEWDGHTQEQAIERISHLADLIDPDYTSEESGYFILPKPREPLVIRDNQINCSVYEIINENAREWQKHIEEDIQQRLFETFRKTCHDTDHMGDAIKCSECGEITRKTLYWVDVGEDARTVKGRMPLFCAHCGAKVVE